MRRLAIISDSHIPERASAIPESFRHHIRDADRVVHAGDLTSRETLEDLRELANGSLTAVAGNMDPPSLGLPETSTLEVEDTEIVVTHGTGDLTGYQDRVVDITRTASDGATVGVAGHTHEVLDTVIDDIRILNPGSVTGAAPASMPTMMTVDVDGEELSVTVQTP